MAVAVTSIQNFSWAGNYPLAFSGTVTSLGDANFALVYFTVGPEYDVTSIIPNAALAGTSLTYLHGYRNTGAAGTIWVWRINNPTAGSLTLSLPFNYIGDGRVTVIGFSGVDTDNPIGGTATAGISATGGTTSTSLVTAAANSFVVSHAMGIYDGTPLLTASDPTASSLQADDSVSNRKLRTYSQSPGAAGTTVTTNWGLTFNQAVISAIEVRESAVATNQNVELTSVSAPGNFGTFTVQRDGPQDVSMNSLASAAAFGTPQVGAVTEILTPADQGTKFLLTRTGAATFAAEDETIGSVASGVARAENRKGVAYGIVVEPGATNLIADNTASGAVVSGAFPNGAGFYDGGITGMTCTVVGKGTEDGIEYVDLRFQGTNGGSEAYPSYNMGAMTNAPVVNGDVLTLSAYARVVAGNHVRTDGFPMAFLGMNVHDSAQGYVASLPNFQPILNRDSLGHAREWSTATVASGSAAYVNPLIAMTIPAGRTFDFTIRLGLPQLEKNAYPTSVIKTAGTTAVARGAEQLTALLDNGTYDIHVERVGITGLRQITTYAGQTITGGQWSLPAVNQFPYIRRISTTALTARPKAKETAEAKGWLLGAAFTLDDYNTDSTYATLLNAETSIYGAEYEFKADQLQPTTEGSFSWTVADNFAARAVTDGKEMRGHALVWNVSTPAWMHTAFTGASEARWKELIDDHIAAVVSRYPNMKSWDVVNEVLEPTQGNPGGFRTWSLFNTAGSAFVAYAFQRARAYDANADLYICEYGMEENDQQAIDRRSAMLTLLTNLVGAGVPVTGLALQAHLDIERPFSRSAFTSFLNSVKALGLKIAVTELDVRAPDADTTLQYDLRAAARVREVLDCVTSVNAGKEIMFWNLRDQYTWLDELGNGRTQRPLPFETTSNTPKAMYAALQEAFEVAPMAAAEGGIEGSVTVTEADDTVVAAGALRISGAVSVTEADDLVAGLGGLAVKGSVSVVEADDTVVATVFVTTPAVVTIVEDDDTVVATGTVTWPTPVKYNVFRRFPSSRLNGQVFRSFSPEVRAIATEFFEQYPNILGQITVVEADDTVVATGTVTGAGEAISGSISITEADDTVSATGALRISGSVTIVEDSDQVAGLGALAAKGVVSVTEADDTVAATGALQIFGAVSVTEADDTVSAAATLKLTGAVSVTEADDTVSATAALRISGAVSVTEADDTVAGLGSLAAKGSVVITEADDTVVATGAVAAPNSGTIIIVEADDTVTATAVAPIVGSITATEADDTVAAAGALLISGSVTATEDPDTVVAAAVAPLTGSVTATEADDTVVAAGVLPVKAAVTITEADDTVSAAAVVRLSGAISITEADDTVAGLGAVAAKGSVTIVEADDTVAATGALRISGAATITEADDTVSAAGVVAAGATGSIVITEADDTVSAAAALLISGSVTATEADDTVVATGALRISGAVSIFEAPDLAAGQGALAIVGQATITEADDTVNASGVLTSPQSGTIVIVEADDTVFASGTVSIRGSITAAEADDVVEAIAKTALKAAVAAIEADDTVVATGALTVKASFTIVEDDDLVAGEGALAAKGQVTITEADDTVSATAKLAVKGAVTINEAPDTVVATGALQAVSSGSIVITEADDVVTASARIKVLGSIVIVEADDLAAGQGALGVKGQVNIVEADDTVVSIGRVPVRAIVSAVEDDDTLVATGRVNISGVITIEEDGDTVVATGVFVITPARVKIWNGTTFREVPIRVWNGSAWVEKPLKVFDGENWRIA